MHSDASKDDIMVGILYDCEKTSEKVILCVREIWPDLPNLETLNAGASMRSSGMEATFFMPGRLMTAETFHLWKTKSEARPVNAEEPVNELVAESPDGRLIK